MNVPIKSGAMVRAIKFTDCLIIQLAKMFFVLLLEADELMI